MGVFYDASCEIKQVENLLNPFNLNQVIKREHHSMKTIGEVFSRMPGATVFSTLDAATGFWQIQLDEESANLTCQHTVRSL